MSELSEYKRLLTELSDIEFKAFIESLTEAELLSFYYDLEWQGRPKQQIPPGEWSNWLILSGRGFGKTWIGAKVVNHWARDTANIALIGDNIGEVRDVMVDGPSGILKMARPDFMPVFNKTLCQLTYPNGSKASGYSGQEPESLRGPNNGKAWSDELFKYRYQQEVWDELQMTMRSGDNPQSLITSTPRPTKLCKALVADKNTHVTRGSTFENYELNKRFLEQTVQKYEGTRRGRQELYGEILDDNPGALWKLTDIEGPRVQLVDAGGKLYRHQMDRITVAIDPATTSNEETSDATGLNVAGRKAGDGYVFHSEGIIATPNEWAHRAVELYDTYKADRIIGEANNGGDMIEAILRNIAPAIPYKKVTATRGKAIRAEPIAALYEQHRIHHVGYHDGLETEQLSFDPAMGRNQKSPNEMDACVWNLTELFGDTIRTPQFFAL